MKIKSNRTGTGKYHPCLHCQKPTQLYKIYCNKECYVNHRSVIITCIKCGKNKKQPKNRENSKYCSIQCANSNIDRKLTRKKAKQTLLNKYGVINPFEIKGYDNLNIKRNGVKIKETFNNKTKEEKYIISNKISESLKNKSIEEKQTIKDKKQITNLKLYGVKSTLDKSSPFRKEAELKLKENQINNNNKWLLDNNLILLDEYEGVKYPNGDIIYYNFKHIPSQTIFIDHLACGRLPIYKDPNKSIGISIMESELQDYIKSFLQENECIFNNRKLVKGFEIDIYIPNYKLAIEFNGIYWHSELNGKNRLYHLYKTEECEKQGIQLIHIFEDEWNYKKDIIKSKIKNLLNKNIIKIYARKCIIKEVPNNIKNEFLNNNHIQGEDKSKFKFGLYYNDELVSLMTFGNLRKITGHNSKDGHYELIRYVTKFNMNIIGGFSKLLSFFIKNYNPKYILSYADRRWSMGKLYEKNGFKFISNTPPNYWYMKHHNYREHRYKYRKSELNKLLPIFNINISEWENMKLNNYDRIWDCGSKKYEYIFK